MPARKTQPRDRLRATVLLEERVCWRCGEPARPDDPLVLGHVVAHVNGGLLARANVHAEHAICNVRAGARGPGAVPIFRMGPRRSIAPQILKNPPLLADVAAKLERMNCPVCGLTLPPPARTGRPRNYCSRVCGERARTRIRQAARLLDYADRVEECVGQRRFGSDDYIRGRAGKLRARAAELVEGLPQ